MLARTCVLLADQLSKIRIMIILVLALSMLSISLSPQAHGAAVTISTYFKHGAQKTIVPNFSGIVSASCDSGDVATGGGVDPGGGKIHSSYPGSSANSKTPDSWNAHISNPLGAASSITPSAYVVCLKPVTIGPVSISTYMNEGPSQVLKSGSDGGAAVVAACHSGDVATGGGLSYLGGALLTVHASWPLSSAHTNTPDKWAVVVGNPTLNDQTPSAIVVCLKPATVGSVTVSTYLKQGTVIALPSHVALDAYATCNSGDVATGGGLHASGLLTIFGDWPYSTRVDSRPNNWDVFVYNPLATTATPSVDIVCMKPVTLFDYSLSNSGGISVVQGGSGTTTITATLIGGTSKSVTLSCDASTLPTGAACKFTPTSVTPSNGGDNSQLTISTASSTPTGAFEVTVTGSPPGDTTAPKTKFMLTVNAAPDFDISSSTNSVSCSPNVKCNTLITVTGKNGFTDDVTFATSPASGLNCDPMAVVINSGTTVLSCKAGTVGDYTVTVTGIALATRITHTTGIITYHVVAGPGFNIDAATVTPSEILVGGGGASSISVTPVGGFTGTVSFQVSSSSPAGLTCGTLADISGATGSTSLSCTATQAADYDVTVTGTGMINGSPVSHETLMITFHFTDFAVVGTPPGPVNADESATSTISVTALNGFTGTVNMAASPSTGLTCSMLASATLPPSPGTVTLSCTAAAQGDYEVTVIGTSGTVSHSTALTVHVIARQGGGNRDFTVGSSKASLSFDSGSSQQSTIQVTSTNGFTGTVNLSVSTPEGVSCTVDRAAIVSSGTATLTCTSSKPGDYAVTVTATSGSVSHTTSLTAHVVSPVNPAAPQQLILGLQPLVFYGVVAAIVAVAIAGIMTVVLRTRKRLPNQRATVSS